MESTRLEFDWLLTDPYHLRGGLPSIETAIRAGRFAGDAMAGRRRRLVEVLAVLMDSPDLSARATIRLARIIAVMQLADNGDLDEGDTGDD